MTNHIAASPSKAQRFLPFSKSTLKTDAIGLGVIAAATVGVFWLGIAPLGNIKGNESRLTQEADALEQATAAQLASARELHQNITEVEALVAEERIELEPPSALNARLATIAAMADEAGVRIDSVQPGETSESGLFVLVPVRIAGTAGYAETAAFLHALSTRYKDTAVTSLSLDAGPAAGAQPRVARLEVALRWHAAPEKDVPVAAAPQPTGR